MVECLVDNVPTRPQLEAHAGYCAESFQHRWLGRGFQATYTLQEAAIDNMEMRRRNS